MFFLIIYIFYFQVELSTEHSIKGLTDEILNCGYTGAVTVQNKESIVRYARTCISVLLGKYNAQAKKFGGHFLISTVVGPSYSTQC